MKAGLGDLLRRNTRASFFVWFAGQTITTVRMLVFIYFLGKAGYGVWIFAFTIMGYFAITNFGIANAFVNYTAECHAQRDYERLSRLLSAGLTFCGLLAITVVALVFFSADALVAFFDAELPNHGDTAFVMSVVGVTTGMLLMFGVYGSVLTGLHRLYIKYNIQLSVGLVQLLSYIGLFYAGYGLRMVVLLYSAGVLTEMLLMRHFVRRLVPGLHLSIRHVKWPAIRSMASMGGRMQLLGIVGMAAATADIMVFMKLFGPAVVGAYGAALRTAERAQTLAQMGFGSIMPLSADMHARQASDELHGLYKAAVRLTAVGVMFIAIFIVVNRDTAMLFIMDEKYDPVQAFLLGGLVIGLMIHSMTGPGAAILRGSGRIGLEVGYQVLAVIILVASMAVLADFNRSPEAYIEPSTHEVFTTWPVEIADRNTEYQYNISIAGYPGAELAAPGLPAWLTLDKRGEDQWTLHGMHDGESDGAVPVTLEARTASGDLIGSQSFAITPVNAFLLMAKPVSIGLASLLFIMLVNRIFGAPWFFPFGNLAVFAAAGALCAWVIRFIYETALFGPAANRWDALLALAVMAFAYGLACLLVVWGLPGLTPKDKSEIVKLIPGAHRFAGSILPKVEASG